MPWDVTPSPQRRFWSSRFWPLPSQRRSCSTPCSWWDREKSQGAEPRAALSRNVGGEEADPEPSLFVTGVLEYRGIDRPRAAPAPAECEHMIMNVLLLLA